MIVLLAAMPLQAAEVKLDIDGLNDELRDSVKASVQLNDYEKRDASPAEIRRLFEAGDEEIKRALEPFGYYQVEVDSELERAEPDTYRAVYKVKLGDPVIVRTAKVMVRGPGAEHTEVREALKAFQPAVGQPLNHAAYENSKTLIDSALKTGGYLDTKLIARRVEVTRADNSAAIDLQWDSGVRYRFGEVRFPDVQLSPKFLPRYIPWKEGTFYSNDLLLTLQQRLVDADYFSAVSVQPLLDEAHDGIVPIEVLLVPAKRTLYSADLYMSTDTGPGARLGIERRWLNTRGHKLGGHIEYSQRLEEAAVSYRIPRPGTRHRNYTFAAGYRDEETDTSVSRTARLAATEATERWHGYTRTLGLQYLHGDFEIADERGNSSLLYAEMTLTQKMSNNPLFPTRGRSLLYGVRLAPESPLSDTSIAQLRAEAKWIQPAGRDGRWLLRGGLGAMAVGDFSALPPELRFFAGGDRSVRGFDYQAIGETNSNDGVIGGEYLVVASTEYEHYFWDNWGAAVFVDAGDAFTSKFDANIGAGLGVRWKSPVGLVRLDIATPLVTDLKDEWRIHLVIGPDL
jgi:translocation and assembly module TamA